MLNCFVAFLFLLTPSLARADDFVASGYSEAGKRSTAEDYEEEDTDDDYTFRNFHLKLHEELARALSYDISSFIYNKDYQSKDSLDNTTRISRTVLSFHQEPSPGESLDTRLDFKLKYREKRYRNTSQREREYDQLVFTPSLTFKKKDLYTVKFLSGINNFDYLAKSGKDEFKVLAGLEGDRYFLKKRLMATASYNMETTKDNLKGGFDYIFDLPWLYKMAVRAGWGERDTKEEEERDDDYDYRYSQYYTRTEHRLSPELKTDLRYQYFQKDYLEAPLDHHGFYIRTGCRYELVDNKSSRSCLDLEAGHKAVDYSLKASHNYKKETAELKLTCERKKGWKASAAWQGNFYHYNDEANDKKRYYLNLAGEKLFLGGDLALSLELKYRYTDYEQKGDTEEGALRLAFRYKF